MEMYVFIKWLKKLCNGFSDYIRPTKDSSRSIFYRSSVMKIKFILNQLSDVIDNLMKFCRIKILYSKFIGKFKKKYHWPLKELWLVIKFKKYILYNFFDIYWNKYIYQNKFATLVSILVRIITKSACRKLHSYHYYKLLNYYIHFITIILIDWLIDYYYYYYN